MTNFRLKRYGAWEERVLTGGAERIRADFVRIIPPLDEELDVPWILKF